MLAPLEISSIGLFFLCLVFLSAYIRERKQKKIYRFKSREKGKTARAYVSMFKELEAEHERLKQQILESKQPLP